MKTLLFTLTAAASLLLPRASCQTETVAKILQAQFSDDPHAASKLVEDAYHATPNDPEIAAYYAVLQANTDVARPVAWKLTRKAPTDSWTLVAQAGTSGLSAVTACDTALAASPSNASILTACTLAILKQTNTAYNAEALTEFLRRYKGRFGQSAYTLLAEGRALRILSSLDHVSRRPELLAAYQAAVQLDSNNADAVIALATELRSDNARAAYDMLKTHAASAPDSWSMHALYWKVASGLPDAPSKQAEVVADAESMATRSRPTIAQYREANYGLDDVNAELGERFRAAIANAYPGTPLADEVALAEALQDTPNTTVEQNDLQKMKALRTLLQRTPPPAQGAADIARSRLVNLVQNQQTQNPDELYRLLLPVQDFGWTILNRLADVKYKLPELERIASAQVNDQFTALRDLKKPMADPGGFVDFWLGDRVNYWLDALGHVYLEEGKLDEAQHTLEISLNLNANDADSHVHLGEVFEARGEYDKAEPLYHAALTLSSLTSQSIGVDALRKLYLHRHGSADGLDTYMKPILVEQKNRFKADILASRDRNPRPLPEFSLSDMHGGKVDSASLLGKYVILNFWATWCGPCRAEHPEYEKLYEKYRNDPKVAILSIAIDDADTPDIVISGYLKKYHYQFAALRGYEYSSANRINSIPLTWFLDPEGRIEFTKVGGTNNLLEEFDWRLEAMRAATVPPGKPL